MNMTIVDLTNIKNVMIEDEVVFISDNSKDKNSVVEIAKKIKSIPYDVLVHINQDLKRVVV